jgi:hypothetical protein
LTAPLHSIITRAMIRRRAKFVSKKSPRSGLADLWLR